MKNLFFDTEFTGLHKNTTLISIGIVSDDGRTFYAELNDYDQSQVDDWLKMHVIDNLLYDAPLEGEEEHYSATRSRTNIIPNDLYLNYSVAMRCDKKTLKEELLRWLSQFKPGIHVWSDCLSYDWVLFNDIFGHAIFDFPKNLYYIPFDICTFMLIKGVDPDVDREEFSCVKPSGMMTKHNALFDALVIKACYGRLIKL
jgi:hypothetical protein